MKGRLIDSDISTTNLLEDLTLWDFLFTAEWEQISFEIRIRSLRKISLIKFWDEQGEKDFSFFFNFWSKFNSKLERITSTNEEEKLRKKAKQVITHIWYNHTERKRDRLTEQTTSIASWIDETSIIRIEFLSILYSSFISFTQFSLLDECNDLS